MEITKAVAAARAFWMQVPPLLPLLDGCFCPAGSFLGCAASACSPWAPRESSSSSHRWAQGTCPLPSLLWPLLPAAGVSFSITHKCPLPSTSLAKGHMGLGAQPFPAQPHPCGRRKRACLLGADKSFMFVTEVHSKIPSEGHPCPPWGLSGVLNERWGFFFVKPKLLFSLCSTLKDTVVQYLCLAKYDWKTRKWKHVTSPQHCHLVVSTGNSSPSHFWPNTRASCCAKTSSITLACKTSQVWMSWRDIALTASNYTASWFANLCSFKIQKSQKTRKGSPFQIHVSNKMSSLRWSLSEEESDLWPVPQVGESQPQRGPPEPLALSCPSRHLLRASGCFCSYLCSDSIPPFSTFSPAPKYSNQLQIHPF